MSENHLTAESLWSAVEEYDPTVLEFLKAVVKHGVAAERERCASIVRASDPVTVYRTDSTGEEWEAVDWPATAEKLEAAIRKGE